MDYIWQLNTRGIQNNSDGDSDNIDIQKYLLDIKASVLADHGLAVGPEKYQLNCNKRTGIQHPLLPEHGSYKGNYHIAGIGIYNRCLLHPVHMQEFAHYRDKSDGYNMHADRHCKCQYQSFRFLRCALDLKCLNDRAWKNKIYSNLRQHITVGGF